MRLQLLTVFLITALAVWGQPNEIDLVMMKKNEIEKKVKANKKDLIVLVKVKGRDQLLRVLREEWPDNIETVFNVLKDQGKIIYVAEFPSSKSGDWTLELKHYFNNDGHTIAFEKRISYFNKDCSDGAIVEKLTDFYAENFKRIATVKQLTDNKDNPVPMHKLCGDPYQWTFEKKGSVAELLKTKKIAI